MVHNRSIPFFGLDLTWKMESTTCITWNLSSSCLCLYHAALLSTPSSVASAFQPMAPILYLTSSARQHHYRTQNSYYQRCSSPFAVSLFKKWSLPFTLVAHTNQHHYGRALNSRAFTSTNNLYRDGSRVQNPFLHAFLEPPVLEAIEMVPVHKRLIETR